MSERSIKSYSWFEGKSFPTGRYFKPLTICGKFSPSTVLKKNQWVDADGNIVKRTTLEPWESVHEDTGEIWFCPWSRAEFTDKDIGKYEVMKSSLNVTIHTRNRYLTRQWENFLRANPLVKAVEVEYRDETGKVCERPKPRRFFRADGRRVGFKRLIPVLVPTGITEERISSKGFPILVQVMDRKWEEIELPLTHNPDGTLLIGADESKPIPPNVNPGGFWKECAYHPTTTYRVEAFWGHFDQIVKLECFAGFSEYRGTEMHDATLPRIGTGAGDKPKFKNAETHKLRAFTEDSPESGLHHKGNSVRRQQKGDGTII